MSKTWFITGGSRGLGRRFAEAALSRGDQVAATARDARHLADLVSTHGDVVLPLALDVTDRAAVTQAVAQAHEHFGRLDVVVNNAGTALIGMVEELTEAQLRAQFEATVFGAVWVTQAALPYLRSQGSGHVVNLSSLLGLASFPTTGAYSAAKAAIEALSDALAQEVSPFGISVTVVEPGPFNTGFTTNSTYSTPLPAYDAVRTAVNDSFGTMPNPEPTGVGPALLAIVDSDAPPARVFFGTLPLSIVPTIYEDRVRGWRAWAEVSAQAEAG